MPHQDTTTTLTPRRASLASQVWTLVSKDLLLEWRGRSRFIAVLLFGFVTLVLFSFALGPDTQALRSGAGGFLVLALLLSSTLALTESFRLEQSQRGLEGLTLLPIDSVALYWAKALVNTLFLILLAPPLLVVAVVLYSVDLTWVDLFRLWGLWILAAAGLSAPGTLYAAMTSRLNSQDVLLPLLLFPLVVPVLLASVKAVSLVLSGDAMGQLGSWTLFLGGFVAVFWSVGAVLFSYLDEQGI